MWKNYENFTGLWARQLAADTSLAIFSAMIERQRE